ncbi:MAG TPA: molybdate ABC transporter permease subunit [Bacillota bacterium]
MPGWVSPLLLSIRIAIVSTAAVFALGTLAAWASVKRTWPGRAAADVLFTLPLVLPPTVTGYILLLLMGSRGPLGRWLGLLGINPIFTWGAAVIASAVVAFPLMYNSAKVGFQGVDEVYEAAARTLGASEGRVFFTVTLPLAWPGLLAGTVLSFTRALGEFGATLMVAGSIPGRTETMPVAIFMATEAGDTKTAGVLTAILLAFGLVTVGLSRSWSTRRYERRKNLRRV